MCFFLFSQRNVITSDAKDVITHIKMWYQYFIKNKTGILENYNTVKYWEVVQPMH